MELFWFLFCVALLVPLGIMSWREYRREIREMTPEERAEDRYQEQIW